MNIQKFFSQSGIAAALVAAAALALAACGGGGYGGGGGTIAGCKAGYGGGGNGSGSGCVGNPAPSPSPSPVAAVVGVRLTGESATTDSTFGTVLGYQLGLSGTTSQVIHLTANTSVQFSNGDATLPHTASFIGTWSGSYPAAFPAANLGATASAAGSTISTANFSSGNLDPGASSLVYNSGGAGMLIFGCFYHYDSNQMRTVIVVM